MSILAADTSFEAEAVLLELMRQAPPWRKIQLTMQLNETVRTLHLEGLRMRFPQASEVELRRRLADALLGPELAAKAYGPLPGGEPRDDP